MHTLTCTNCKHITNENNTLKSNEKRYLTSKIVCENCGHELILANTNLDSNDNLLNESQN